MVRKKKVLSCPNLEWVSIIRDHGRLLVFPFEELNQAKCYFEAGLTDSSFDLVEPVSHLKFRRRSGVYLPYAGKHLMYIGASGNIFGRLSYHPLYLEFLRTKKKLAIETNVMLLILEGFDHPYKTSTDRVSHPAFILEKLLIKYFKPKFNSVPGCRGWNECDLKSENFDADSITVDRLIDTALLMIEGGDRA
jgi:hypothetical protein